MTRPYIVAAAAELRAKCCFSNLSHEQLYISLCNFLLLHMEASTGTLLDLAFGLAEEQHSIPTIISHP